MSIEELSLDLFLQNNRISPEDWSKANIDFDDLKSIGIEHENRTASLDDAANFLAKVLQKCSQVHSVRWRVKKPEHLLEKIVRKRVQGSEKYQSISMDNYSDIITDLVGVRVLHLFKYEWLNIQEHILNHWAPIEEPIAYIRAGDEGGVVDKYKENGCEVKHHPAGYRSIHYVISTQPTLKKVFSEIQVRTIFEEGWSEIDHKIRYPNFSDNELISYFLTIFNRMAGSADEMGSFVRDLTSEITIQELRISEINREQEEHLSKIESLAAELSSEKNKNKNKDGKVSKLNDEIQKLRSNSRIDPLTEYKDLISGSIGSQLAKAYSDIAGKHAASLSNINSSILGGSLAAQLAAMNQNILGGNSTAKLAQINSNMLGGNVAAQLAASNALGATSLVAKNLLGETAMKSLPSVKSPEDDEN